MEAVIWTEVLQGIVKTTGAIVILYLVIGGMNNGVADILRIGGADGKFSPGSFSLSDFNHSTFWVVFLYGFFINLNNFGMDQNYVQRYHTARSEKEASRSIWLCVYWYVPVSMLFFFIGTALYAYAQQHPEVLLAVKQQAAAERHIPVSMLQPADYGDKVLPWFMVTKVPSGLMGLIVAAILSAAMSTVSSGMNSTATVFLKDIYQRYMDPAVTPKREMRVLYAAATLAGLLAIFAGISMIGVGSILDMWWDLAGIFAGGMLGLFLLGMVSGIKNAAAVIATIIGILIIVWMSLSKYLPAEWVHMHSHLHAHMVIVVGTLAIFLTGMLLTQVQRLKTS